MIAFVSPLDPVANGPVEHPKMSRAVGFWKVMESFEYERALFLTCPATLPYEACVLIVSGWEE